MLSTDMMVYCTMVQYKFEAFLYCRKNIKGRLIYTWFSLEKGNVHKRKQ